MFTFKSVVSPTNIWNLCFRDKEEMSRIYYENRTPEEGVRIYGVTDYEKSTIYLDKNLDGFMLVKTLRHELTHVYLWETGQQGRVYNEEELCEVMSVATPLINKLTEETMLRLKEGLYKKGE